MKKVYLNLFLFSVFFLLGCIKHKDTPSPTIKDFLPTKLRVGQKTKITFKGLNLNDKIEIKSSSIEILSHPKVSADKTEIEIEVRALEGGTQDLRTEYLNQVNSWAISCEHPEIYAIDADTVIVGIPQTIIMTGKNLDDEVKVTLNDFTPVIYKLNPEKSSIQFMAEALRDGAKEINVSHYQKLIKTFLLVAKYPQIDGEITPAKVYIGEEVKFKISGSHLTEDNISLVANGFTPLKDVMINEEKKSLSFSTTALKEGYHTILVKCKDVIIKVLHIEAEVKRDMVDPVEVRVDSVQPFKVEELNKEIEFSLYGEHLGGVQLDPLPDFSTLSDKREVSSGLLKFKAMALREGTKTLVVRDSEGEVVKTLSINVVSYLPPYLDSISPMTVSKLNQEVEFTLFGKNLSFNISIAPIQGFSAISSLNVLSSSKVSFRVTTPSTPGSRLVLVKDRNHEVFKALLINVLEPAPLVDSVIPREVRLGESRTMSVYGKNLSSKLILNVDGFDATLKSLSLDKGRADFEVEDHESVAGQKVVEVWSNFERISVSNVLILCPETMSFDGETYRVVRIGQQCWMAENMKSSSHTEGESWCDTDPDTCAKYGRLYDGYAARDISEKVPRWHLASDQEWKMLEKQLGMSDADIDKKVSNVLYRSSGSVGQKIQLGGPTGFDALYGGYRVPGASDRTSKGSFGLFFTNTGDPLLTNTRWYRYIEKGKVGLGRMIYDKNITYKCSLRLVMGDI